MACVPYALAGSAGLDVAVGVLWLTSVDHQHRPQQQMAIILVATSIRFIVLAIFAGNFYYRGRYVSMHLPILWETANLTLIAGKSIYFLHKGAPFKEAWLLLGLCAASIGLELVFVAHLRSSAGTLRLPSLPSQHVFLPTAVGAMVTMNLTKNPTKATLNTPRGERDLTGDSSEQTDGSVEEKSADTIEDGWQGHEERAEIGIDRQSSFYERKRFLSDWNKKVEELRENWASKVEELREKMRHRAWGGADGSGGERAPLLLLARMYTQERSAIDELQDMWNRNPKWTEFFLPQSSRVEEILLARCESSVHVAHTIYWFLKAFCVARAGVTPVGVKAIEQMLHEVVLRGERPALAFCEQGWGGNDDDAARCLELFDSRQSGGESKEGQSLGGYFNEAPSFVYELVKIASELGEVEKHQRTEELRRRLGEVQTRFLPSRAIYLPVGRQRHRVYRIVLQESFSFSTKDRAPYLVTLEVLDLYERDYSAGQGGARASTAWSLHSGKGGLKGAQQFVNVENPLPRPKAHNLPRDLEASPDGAARLGDYKTLEDVSWMGMWSKREEGPSDVSSHPEGLPSPARQPSATVSSINCSCGGGVEPKASMEGFPYYEVSGESWRGDGLSKPTVAAWAAAANGLRTAGGGMGTACGSACQRVDTLLLSRNGSSGSAKKAAYGAAGSSRTMASDGGQSQSRMPSSQSHSPRRRKRRSWGYAELRESVGEGLGLGDYVMKHVAGGEGAWRDGKEEHKDQDLEKGDGDRKGEEMVEDDVGEGVEGKIEEEEGEGEEEDTNEDENAGSAPTVIFKERWKKKEARLRVASRLGRAAPAGWRLMPIIVKAGDDLRQEQVASQFFYLANKILKQSPLCGREGLRPYDIVATSPDAGVIEAIPDTVSLDALKKNDPLYTTLSNFFHRHFGPPESEGFLRARRYFMESLAANCIVTYLLQVKDRHNGNILLDAKGRVIHIDFGFMLANSPGGNFRFESAPFKLTAEFVDLMDGPSSACFKEFREVCVQTFMALRRKMSVLILHIETSSVGNAHLPCFGMKPKTVVAELRARFMPEVHDGAAMAHVHSLIDRSMKSWRTSWYDLYQNYAVGIAM